jgi:siroheme synthase
VSGSFTVVTGHRVRDGSLDVAWEALAQVGGTIVILMGVSERAVIAERLMAGGLPADTPVAAVRWGTCPNQHTTRTTLSGLAAAAIQAPATIVIGAVAAFDLVSPPLLHAAADRDIHRDVPGIGG